MNCSLRALAAGLHARSRPSACRLALRACWSETIFQAYSKRDDLWHPGYTFIFFELNNYPVCDLKLILDTNIFITATISCTMCMLPLDLYKNVRGRERHKTRRPERLGSSTNFIQLSLNYFSKSKNMLSSTDNFS